MMSKNFNRIKTQQFLQAQKQNMPSNLGPGMIPVPNMMTPPI